MTLIIDGKKLSKKKLDDLAVETESFSQYAKIRPTLAVIIVGNDPASNIYVNKKQKTCSEYGFGSKLMRLDHNTSQLELLQLIQDLNRDDSIHGVLVQQPFPEHIDVDLVSKTINPTKDVDGFHPENMGLLLLGQPRFIPCTPLGILELFSHYNIEVAGKHVVVLGRSNIVGKPIAALLSQKASYGNATVSIGHSRSSNLQELAAQADILITAIGRAHLVKENWIKQGAVVIDVGINRIDDSTQKKGYKVVGDVDFEAVQDKSSAITPVPGGVGPMTIAMLLSNTINSAKIMHNDKNK